MRAIPRLGFLPRKIWVIFLTLDIDIDNCLR